MSPSGNAGVRSAALRAHEAGLCIVPPREDGSKAPDVATWKEFQTRRSTPEEITAWYAGDRTGVGVICGAVSDGLEMLEFEGRGVAEGIYDRYRDLAEMAGVGDVLDRVLAGYTERTPSGGLHLLYRCSTPKPSTKLARRPSTVEDLARDPRDTIKVLIETRGEHGYCVVAPSNGRIHPTGRAWSLVRGGFATIATIADEERDGLWRVAQALDQVPPAPPRSPRVTVAGELPGDRYNALSGASDRTLELLLGHGWTTVARKGETIYLRRPGKQTGISATLGFVAPGILYVFSTSTGFDAPRSYDPFGVFAILEHGGDFTAAARALGPTISVGGSSAGSAPAGQSTEPPEGLRFYAPAELATLTRFEPEWVCRPGLAALGAITEVDGKIKAAGKTTLVLHMVRAILDGAPFLGYPTRRSRVIYVTEQSRQTFTDALRRAGLDRRGDELLILFREDIGATPWTAVVGATRRAGYDVVVFDTIGKLAGIREENSAGEWALAMSPLQDLAASDRAVFVARHDRKSGGDVGDSGRGSSQASGDVDIILALRRPEGNQPASRRVIESLSRYTETPEKIVVELTDAGYILLGTDEAVAAGGTCQAR